MSQPNNHLLAALPQRDRKRLVSICEAIDFAPGDVLSEAGESSRHIYLPTAGFASLLTLIDGAPGLGVAMVGREGIVGAQLALGVSTAPFRAVVQGHGAAWRVETEAFQSELSKSIALQLGLKHYLYLLMSQLARSAACPHVHRIGPRLARWLLMSQDHAHSDSFHVTHEFLAAMLGVRRVGITSAAGGLQRKGFIQYHRGDLTVTERSGLRNAACSCYAADRHAFTLRIR